MKRLTSNYCFTNFAPFGNFFIPKKAKINNFKESIKILETFVLSLELWDQMPFKNIQ